MAGVGGAAGAAANAAKGGAKKIAKDAMKFGGLGQQFLFGTAVDFLMNTAAGASPVNALGNSIATGAGYTLLNAVAPGAMWAQLAFAAGSGLTKLYFNTNRKAAEAYRSRRDPGNMNWNFRDSEQAYTMRQAAVQAIQGSKMNARSALGGEAKIMHMGLPNRW
jgi:hypothetical protein